MVKEAEKTGTEAEVIQTGPTVEVGLPGSTTGKMLSNAELEKIAGTEGADAAETKTKGNWFVALDLEGRPTGGLLERPPEDTPYISVTNIIGLKPEVLMTPSGAPITEHMNPEHSFLDPWLEARNPRPKKSALIGDKVERNSNVGQKGGEGFRTVEVKASAANKGQPATGRESARVVAKDEASKQPGNKSPGGA